MIIKFRVCVTAEIEWHMLRKRSMKSHTIQQLPFSDLSITCMSLDVDNIYRQNHEAIDWVAQRTVTIGLLL